MNAEQRYPAGWDEARIQRVISHYEDQTEEDAAAEDEESIRGPSHTIMEIPADLIPAVRELIARRHAG